MISRWALAVRVGLLLAAAAPVPTGGQDPAVSISGAVPDAGLVQVASDLGPITSIANAGDSRLFLTLRTGRIVIWDGTGLLPKAFLDISRRVSTKGSRGLFSIAFHPKYAVNGLFFLSYTDTAGNLTVARYKRQPANANRADAASGIVLLTIPLPADAENDGGELQFGPDGYLYLGVGDGGSGEDSPCTAQRDDVLLGKILRLNVKKAARLSGKSVEMIWAKGLRDPRQFSFDRATGDLYIGDVGQTSREEVDFEPAGSRGGRNYGWRVMEGSACAAGAIRGCPRDMPPCKSPRLELPVYEYNHDEGDCAIVGGYVYRGSHLPGLRGVYFYGDACSGRIWGGLRPMGALAPGLSTFGEDAAGELYAGTENGALYRMVTPQEAVRYQLTVRAATDAVEQPAPAPPPPEFPTLRSFEAPPAPSPAPEIPVVYAPVPVDEPLPVQAAPEDVQPQPQPQPTPPPAAPTEPARPQPAPADRDLPPPRIVRPH